MSTKITLSLLLALSAGLFCVFYFTKPSTAVNAAKVVPTTTTVIAPQANTPQVNSTIGAPVVLPENDTKAVSGDENARTGQPHRNNAAPLGRTETVH